MTGINIILNDMFYCSNDLMHRLLIGNSCLNVWQR